MKGNSAWPFVRRLWRRLASVLLPLTFAACSTPILAVNAAMEMEDGRTRFVAYAERDVGISLNGVEGVEIHFFVDGKEVAAAKSNTANIP